jgi:hypothetical protein
LVVEVVGDELKIFEADGLVLGELGVEWVVVASGDNEFR